MQVLPTPYLFPHSSLKPECPWQIRASITSRATPKPRELESSLNTSKTQMTQLMPKSTVSP